MIRRIFVKSICILFIFTFLVFYTGSGIEFSTPSAIISPPSVLRLATAPGSSDPTGDEWPMFRGSLNHTGVAYTSPTIHASLLWEYTTGDDVGSSPAVVGGRVYVGSSDSKFYCLDATTGAHLWNYTMGAYVYSSPAVTGGRVYVGSGDDKVYCLDATTGAHLWDYPTGADVDSSPAVAGGCVYVGNWDGKIYCLNATTGAHLWNYSTGIGTYGGPAVVDGCVYVGDESNKIYCLNATTGRHLWNYTTSTWVDSSPAVAGGRVYAGDGDGKIYCLNATTGKELWNYTTGGYIYSSPAIAGGHVYLGSGDGKIYCLNATTGQSLWNYTTEAYGADSSPVVAGGRVYMGSGDGKIYCLNATTGKQVWNYTTGAYIISSPAITGGRVYIGSSDNNIYCLPAILDTTPPTYSAVTESANTLELGDTEIITISDVADLYGIQMVRIEFEGTNHTMINLGGGSWYYNTWIPISIGAYPYKIFIQDNAGNYNTTIGTVQVVDTTPPTYVAVIEGADHLELGSTEIILITGLADLSGIQTVRIAFEGTNHTMSNLGGGFWCLNLTPNTSGTLLYIIYIQDNDGNWNAVNGSILVSDITAAPNLDWLIWLLSLVIVGFAVLMVVQYLRLNKRIKKLSSPKTLPPKDLPKK